MADSNHPPHSAATTDAELLQAAFRYALALTHQVEDAEDLAQEAWLSLCKTYGRVDSQALLFTAVRHLFVDQCRRRKIVQFDPLDEDTAARTPGEPTEVAGIKGDLETLLSRLRPVERETLFLHYFQGHTAEEISQLTSQPRNTVLSIMHRAIGKLRAAAVAEPLTKIGNHLLLLLATCL